jgi:hypothetical protein
MNNDTQVHVRSDLKTVLDRIRMDESFASFDHVIREAVKKVYPRYAFDL